jgi:hypothetical protein
VAAQVSITSSAQYNPKEPAFPRDIITAFLPCHHRRYHLPGIVRVVNQSAHIAAMLGQVGY